MKKIVTCILLASILSLTACKNGSTSTTKTINQANPIEVGIIIPIEHPAMDEITKGFENTLSATLNKPIEYTVMRAQGDINLQRSMILQLQQNPNITLLAPIATQTTEMTAAMVEDKPIVGIAALLPDSVRQKSQLALVNDEITPTQIIHFIHAIYPNKTHFALVYHNDDKIQAQADEAVAAGQKLGITIDKRMISVLPDLYSVAQSLPPQTEGIIILKDVTVASGIATLANVADKKHIPLISADDGTVQNGSGFALGVKEYQIGVESAKVAAKILQGTPASQIPVVSMTQLSVFINPQALQMQNQDMAAIQQQYGKSK